MKKGSVIFLIGMFFITPVFMAGCLAILPEPEKTLITCGPSVPRPTVAVMDFEINADHDSSQELADEFGNMLANALEETQCFRVADRSQMKDLLREKGLGTEGTVDQPAAVSIGKLTGSQLMITGSVTKFEEAKQANFFTINGQKIYQSATIHAFFGLTVTVMDSTTGEILESKSFEEKDSSKESDPMGIWNSQAMHNAARKAVMETVGIVGSHKEKVTAFIPVEPPEPSTADISHTAAQTESEPETASPTAEIQPAPAVEEAPAKVAMSDKEMIRQIQDCLTKLGYSPGPIDGKMGGKTRAAIKAYQHDAGMTQDGKATDSLLEALKSQI